MALACWLSLAKRKSLHASNIRACGLALRLYRILYRGGLNLKEYSLARQNCVDTDFSNAYSIGHGLGQTNLFKVCRLSIA
jgi:hypothetical protein